MLRAAEVVIAENAHGFYCVPRAAAQRPAALKIISGEVWEPETVDFIVRNCAERSVVHAGAFFGDFLPAISRALVADALLYTAEPNPENYASSQWTVRINGLRNVRLFGGALGVCAGTAEIIVKDEAGHSLGGWSRVKTPSGQVAAERLVTAQVQSIDQLCGTTEIGIIHLDVEGYETQALEGAMQTVRRCRPILILETAPSAAWLQTNLTPLDYRPTAKLDANTNTVFSTR